jgi:hypothetical protein
VAIAPRHPPPPRIRHSGRRPAARSEEDGPEYLTASCPGDYKFVIPAPSP